MTNTTATIKTERRYLSTWSYNAALILEELESIIKSKGGAICATWQYASPPAWLTQRKQYEITNRTLDGAKREIIERLEKLEKLGREEAAAAQREKLKEYEEINNAPRVCYYGDYLYIHFVLNGYCYYYQMDRNPFFDFNYGKVAIENGDKINRLYYMNGDSKKWLKDIYFSFGCDDDARKKAAQNIFNMLIAAPTCHTYRAGGRAEYTTIYKMEEAHK